jgi:hypothetical protein
MEAKRTSTQLAKGQAMAAMEDPAAQADAEAEA